MVDDPASFVRFIHSIEVVHGEAFQLMLYLEDPLPSSPGERKRLWIWNSRDGVTPFVVQVDGVTYQHAMRGYPVRYTAALPSGASHVFVDYTPDAWRDMSRKRWQMIADTPKGEWHDPEEFKEQFPTAESFDSADPYRPGEPMLVARDEFLARTHSWMARNANRSE